MKIAVYSGNIPSTTFIENLINNLSSTGIKILLFGKKFREVKYNENVEILDTPDSGPALLFFIIKESFKSIFRNPALYSKALRKIFSGDRGFKNNLKELGMILPIINNEPDIFHIQWGKTLHKNPYLFELMSCRFALSLRGAHINYSPINDKALAESYKKYFPLIDGFHAVSEAISKEAQKYGADSKKIKVIYSGVSDEFQNRIPAHKSDSSEILKIISIGRYHWKKGYHYALDAMKIMIKNGIKFKYTIIAQGDVPEEILFMLDDTELKSRVELKSGMPHDLLMKELSGSDILILPSVEEGIANVVLESMALGIPVISTDCGGMNEAITDGADGFIVKLREPEMLAEKITELGKMKGELKEEIILSALNKVKKKFSNENLKKGFQDFYVSILNT
ncbi:MAG: glycosyltransferase family 4 protein [Ignavibacteria bacterium]|nr:glycosyltransferase family 4 protein [Ignavibacteria bacterium]